MSGYLLDANVWLALTLSGHQRHRACLAWFDSVSDSAAVVMPRAMQLTLMRLLTTSVVLNAYGRAPLTNDEAWLVVDEILSDHRVVAQADEPIGLDERWRRYSRHGKASPKLWMDAYLAAYAVAADCSLVTLDGAFAQYAELSWLMPGNQDDSA